MQPFSKMLRRVPRSIRDDVVSEMWLAFLEGGIPAARRARDREVKRLRRRSEIVVPGSELDKLCAPHSARREPDEIAALYSRTRGMTPSRLKVFYAVSLAVREGFDAPQAAAARALGISKARVSAVCKGVRDNNGSGKAVGVNCVITILKYLRRRLGYDKVREMRLVEAMQEPLRFWKRKR